MTRFVSNDCARIHTMQKFCPFNMTPEEMADYTREWTGERFADGRPRISDSLIERARKVSVTGAWGVLRNEGYHHQYEGNWQCTHPGQVLAGRALTAMYMPRRPNMRTIMEEKGAEAGCIGDQISWPIDLLVPGDVYVADVYGKIDQGPIIGDNLATSILAKSGNGVVHDAAVRDLDGIQELPGFTSFVRGWHPSYASPTIMLMGVNCPIRIGGVTVMAGDLVLGKQDGVIFIPVSSGRESGQGGRAGATARCIWQRPAGRGQIHLRRNRHALGRPH